MNGIAPEVSRSFSKEPTWRGWKERAKKETEGRSGGTLRAHQKVKIFCNEGQKTRTLRYPKLTKTPDLEAINYTARFAKGNYEELYRPP